MKASDFDSYPDTMTCFECGYIAKGHLNKKRKWIRASTVLAGHIMRSRDHYNKKWARKILFDADVGTGLWGDKKGW